jgi:DNA-binding transcriptional LysR family regulator
VAKATQLLAAAEDLVGIAPNAQEPLSGPLRLGVIPTIGPYVLPFLLEHVDFLLPYFDLFLREDQAETLLDKLADGSLDILLLAKPYDLSSGRDVPTALCRYDSIARILTVVTVGHAAAIARKPQSSKLIRNER